MYRSHNLIGIYHNCCCYFTRYWWNCSIYT